MDRRRVREFSIYEHEPAALITFFAQRIEEAMGAAQSAHETVLAQFDQKFMTFMDTGDKDEAEVLMTACIDNGEEYKEIPNWKRAAVFAAAKAWGLDFTEGQEIEWQSILKDYSLVPRDTEYYAPIGDMEDFLNVMEMLIKGWNVAEATRKDKMVVVPDEMDVAAMVHNRLEVILNTQHRAFPSWFIGRMRNIHFGYNLRVAANFGLRSSASSEGESSSGGKYENPVFLDEERRLLAEHSSSSEESTSSSERSEE